MKYIYWQLIIMLFSCSSSDLYSNSKAKVEIDEEKVALQSVIEKSGFSSNYDDSKCVGSYTTENTIDGVERRLVSTFIKELNVDFDLDSVFNVDNGFYPISYKWEGNILVLEYIQVGEHDYRFRNAFLDFSKKEAYSYDLYTNDDVGNVKISKQSGNDIVTYSIFTDVVDGKDKYIYSKEKCNPITKVKEFLLKDTVLTIVEIDQFFCEGAR